MGELEAQSAIIEQLRAELDRQHALPPLKLDVDIRAKRAKHDARHARPAAAGGQQARASDDDAADDDQAASTAVSTLPDFNRQLASTLQKELEECRRQNAGAVARAHEASAKIRFLTEESSRKDKQIAQLQANLAKLKSETREAESGGSAQVDVEAISGGGEAQRPATTGKSPSAATGRGRGKERPSDRQELAQQTPDDEDDEAAEGRMKLTQLIAAAKRQKRPSSTTQSAADVDAAAVEEPSEAGRTGRTTRPAGKLTRGARGRAKMGAGGTAAPAAAAGPAVDKQPHGADDVPQMTSNFWQKSAVQQWAPQDTDVDNTGTSGADQATTARGAVAAQPTPPVSDIDMNEAIEMTKLFLAGPPSQQQQQQQQESLRGGQHASVGQQRQATSATTHVTAISPQLFASSPQQRQQQQQRTAAPGRQRSDDAALSWQGDQRARTPAEAAKMRAARLSVVLAQPRPAPPLNLRRPQPPSPAPATAAASTARVVQPKHAPLNVVKSKPLAKAAGYDLVGVQVHNLARQAKLLETGAVPPTTRPRLS